MASIDFVLLIVTGVRGEHDHERSNPMMATA